MKKIMVIIALAVVAGGQMQAQDTVYRDTPLSNYYCTYWPDTTDQFGCCKFYEFEGGYGNAKRFITEDTLVVYGIAAAMITPLWDILDDPCYPIPYWFEDTLTYMKTHYANPDIELARESLILFQYQGNGTPRMQQRGDSLIVQAYGADATPVSYYLQTDIDMNAGTGRDTCFFAPFPIYERYFSSPQMVFDTFYTAFTQTQGDFYYTSDSSYWGWSSCRHLELDVPAFMKNVADFAPEGNQIAVYRKRFPNAEPTWQYYNNHKAVFFIFPILTPQSEQPGDPVAVQEGQAIDRYVSLNPNPASERVEVVSSFGLQRIEAFDGGGRQMLDVQAEGMQAVLDVRGWAGGTYLLRITTPMGTTTKKLLVR